MIAIGSDHLGYELKEEVKNYFELNKIPFMDFGTSSKESVDYPIYAKKVCTSIQTGDCKYGILICGTGTGMAIAANKIKGIRAACCSDTYTAKMARLHNNAQILTMGSRVTGSGVAIDIIKIFLATDFEGGRHIERVNMLN